MKRFFEKYVQEKRPDLNLLEGWAIFFLSFLFFVAAVIINVLFSLFISTYDGGAAKGVGWFFSLKYFSIFIYLLSAVYGLRAFFRYIGNKFRRNRKKERNVVIVDETKDPIGLNYFFQDRTSFLYRFFREPYIYRMKFLVDKYNGGDYNFYYKKLFFNLPPHKSYDNEKDYLFYLHKYKDEERKTNLDRSQNFAVNRNSYFNKYDGKFYREYTYYITYEKAQAFNCLFEIVDLPAFRIIVCEEQKSLLEIHPIEGREYPEEVYELLEKINGMYP